MARAGTRATEKRQLASVTRRGPWRSIEGQVAGDDGRATLVALGEHLEQQLGSGLRQRHVAELIDDQQLVGGELALQAQEPLLVARLHQLVDNGGCSREADR